MDLSLAVQNSLDRLDPKVPLCFRRVIRASRGFMHIVEHENPQNANCLLVGLVC